MVKHFNESERNNELHVFVVISTVALAAVAYIRIEEQELEKQCCNS